ncbi:MAG: FapA family protein, partial [Desulfobacteraceae bacterium]|nr:FapA family protein [Desulfobacteraceae bacterium]
GQRLFVNGAVQPGFKVKCKGDVFIGQGLQYSAAVTAGGNLEIKGGAIGHEIVIKCWGNVVANFLDNVGRLEVKGDLTVTESMIGGRGMVGGNIRVLGGQGVLAGGQFVVGGSVFVKELGSEDEVQTELSVGVNPALEEKKAALTQEKELWAERMNELLRNTTGLKVKQKEKGAAFPAEQLALLKKYNQMLPGVMERVNQLTEAEEKMEAEIEQAASEAIYVYGDLYPGAKITIGGVTRALTSHEHGVVIHFDREKRQIHCRTMTPEEKQGGSG